MRYMDCFHPFSIPDPKLSWFWLLEKSLLSYIILEINISTRLGNSFKVHLKSSTFPVCTLGNLAKCIKSDFRIVWSRVCPWALPFSHYVNLDLFSLSLSLCIFIFLVGIIMAFHGCCNYLRKIIKDGDDLHLLFYCFVSAALKWLHEVSLFGFSFRYILICSALCHCVKCHVWEGACCGNSLQRPVTLRRPFAFLPSLRGLQAGAAWVWLLWF